MATSSAQKVRDRASAESIIDGVAPRIQNSCLQNGRSLLEMLIVVAIIGLAAAVAVQSTNSAQLQRLALSTSEVSDAYRFAREEASRTGVMHGVSIDVPANAIRVFRLDESPNPNVMHFDVRHPVTKQPYDVQLNRATYVGVELSNYGGQIAGSCPASDDMAFDRTGVLRCTEPATTRFLNATIELTSGFAVQGITIDGYTGRVSGQ